MSTNTEQCHRVIGKSNFEKEKTITFATSMHCSTWLFSDQSWKYVEDLAQQNCDLKMYVQENNWEGTEERDYQHNEYKIVYRQKQTLQQ